VTAIACARRALLDRARYTRDFEALILRMVERHDRAFAREHLLAPSCAIRPTSCIIPAKTTSNAA
jgi:hypothetical protein